MALSLYLVGAVLAGYILWQVLNVFNDPLRSVPGPFFARFTRLWCFRTFKRGNWHEEIIALHRKYGPVVRYAPGQYSFSSPDALKPIGGHGGGLDKSSFYEPWSAPGTTSLFKEQSNKHHGDLRKRFAAIYSMTSTYAYERGVDHCIELLCMNLDGKVGREVDLAWWINCLAFDCIGIVSYGKRLGFLDAGEDVENLSKAVHGAFKYGSAMGIFPEWHAPFIATMRFLRKWTGRGGTGKMYIDQFTRETTIERKKQRIKDPEKVVDAQSGATSILDKFLDANEKDPVYFTEAHISLGLGANITAGADTTAASTTMALWYMVTHPESLARVRDEISSAIGKDNAISFRSVQSLIYLNAVVDETLRLFPQTGFGLPRVVPPGGAEICGHYFPAGSVVSPSAWAMHHDAANFDDPEAFRPERWLRLDGQDKQKMNAAYFPFGLGSRTCIGKSIAQLVMLKTLVQLVHRFDYELVGSLKNGGKMKIQDIFLVRAEECPVIVRPRS